MAGKLLRVLALITLLAGAALARGAAQAETLYLQAPFQSAQLGPHMQSWCDGDGQSSLADAQLANYQPIKRQQINFGYREDACWFRIQLANNGASELPLWLQVDYAILDHVDFYLVDGLDVLSLKVGDTLPFSSRPVHIRTYTLPFTLGPHQQRTLYLRVQTLTSAMTVPIELSGRDRFIEKQSSNEWFMGGFYGISLGLFFYHLVLWLSGREQTSRFYVMHLAAAILYVASMQGVIHRFWFPDLVLPQSVNHLFGYLTLLSGLLFARDYLHTWKWRWLDRLLLTVVAIQAMFALLLITLPDGSIARMQGVTALLTLSVLLLAGLFCMSQRQPEARIFVIAWSTFLLTVTLLALGAYGVLTLPGILNIIGVQVGLVAQQVLLSFGLAGRLRILKQESLLREQEIARAKAENEAKSDFLAKMSHEIRTPMNAVLGLAELMRGTRLDATQRNYVDTIYSAGDSLLNVINDILDFSKISSGKLQLEVSDFNLHQLLEDCLMIFHANAEQKGIRLISDWNDSLPSCVAGDATRLRQILLNLLSNAIKFTDHGAITLQAQALVADDSDDVLLECRVSDQGIGMSREELARLFQSFQQADSSTSRRYGGTGLGLAISRQLAELMQGSLDAESTSAQGSTFILRIPLKRSTHCAPPAREEPRLGTEGLRVLVVEDNAVNQMVIGALLKKLGTQVQLASNGEEALTLLASPQPAPDLVLMDCEMPGLDGYETTRQIRLREQQQKLERLPILALTAHATTEHRERCFASGMDDHIAKPVTLTQLKDKLLEWAPQQPLQAESGGLSPGQGFSSH